MMRRDRDGLVVSRLNDHEEARRREVYELGLTDRESARHLGISPQAYQAWRARRILPPWRAERTGHWQRGTQ